MASVRTAASACGHPGARLADVCLVVLLAGDVALRLHRATSHLRCDCGDLLAPFSLTEQFLYGPLPDAGRQQVLLPALLALLMRVAAVPNNIVVMLKFCHAFTAVFSSLCLVPVYLIGRRLLSAWHGFAAALLLAANGTFAVDSYYYNPTQVYAFIFTCTLLCLLVPGRRALWAAAVLAGLGYAVRHEGLLLVVLLVVVCVVRWRRAQVTAREALVGTLLTAGLAAATWAVHWSFSVSSTAFLQNTGATAGWWSILHGTAAQAGRVLLQSANLLVERAQALAVIHTLMGIVLVPLGATLLARRNKAIWWGPVHLLLYEAVVFALIVAQPVTDQRYESLPIGTPMAGITRYYQVWTPVLVLLAYAGAWGLAGLLVRSVARRILLVGTAVVLFIAQQQAALVFSYRRIFAPDDRSKYEQVYALAQFFRDRGIRNRQLVVARSSGRELLVPGTRDLNPLSRPVYLSILTGHNDVNCWHFDLLQPNADCQSRDGVETVADLAARIHIDYLITSAPSEHAARYGPLVYAGPKYYVYECGDGRPDESSP
jgi:hypothetical protein